eukprot:589689_1
MKKEKQFFVLVFLGFVLYITFECYVWNGITMQNILVNMQCEELTYPNTYYRKQFGHGDDPYSVYCIQIGQLYSKQISPTQIEDLSDKISEDMLWFKHYINQTDSSSMKRKHLYDIYFNDFQRNRANKCPQQNRSDSVDFFEFTHFGGKHTNDPKQTPINWYKLLPISDVLNDTHYTTKAKHIGNNINDEYYLPALYTYVLSVDKSGSLRSLELRFGEIVNEIQHDEMKHLMLNNNKRHILWAGEFYYIYDYKWRKYVLLVDNASGHWKPKTDKIPTYLHHMLIATLFPSYNVSVVDQDDDPFQFKNYYRPLILLGYHDHPWHELKSILFPVVRDINNLYKTRKIKKIQKFIQQVNANANAQIKFRKHAKRKNKVT